MLNGINHAWKVYKINGINEKLFESPALYLSHTIKTFAQSLMGLFIPIYIFTLPDAPQFTSSSFTNGLLLILIFYLIRSIAALTLMTFITNTIFGYLNFKKSIFMGNVFLAASLILLAFSTSSIFFLYLSAITFAIDTTLYWIPYHLFFIRKSSNAEGHYGRTFGIRVLLSNLASAAGPILGGLIITYLSFTSLFISGTFLILIAALPILWSVTEGKHGKHNAKHIFNRCIRDKSLRNDTIAMAAIEMDALLYSIFWPILLFVIAASFTKIGIIATISITISSIVALVIGDLVDKKGAKLIHKIGSIMVSILYVPRIFISDLQAIYLLDVMDRLNGILYGVPFNAKMYEHARNNMHDSDFIVYRAMVIHIAIIFVTILTMVLINILASWRYIFLVMAVIAPFAYLINRPSR